MTRTSRLIATAALLPLSLTDLLRARPLRLAAPGITVTTFTYADLIADTEQWLHDPSGYQGLFPELTDLARLTAPEPP